MLLSILCAVQKLYQELKENEFCAEQDKHQPPVPVNLDDPVSASVGPTLMELTIKNFYC